MPATGREEYKRKLAKNRKQLQMMMMSIENKQVYEDTGTGIRQNLIDTIIEFFGAW